MAILMEEGYWANSQYSIARYYGGVRVKDGSDNGKYHEFEIVNKQGITLIELSDPGSKHFVKDGMAIKPGEPADLVDVEFIPFYKELGREKFISLLCDNRHATRKELKSLFKDAVKK